MGSATILGYKHTKLEQFLLFGHHLPICRVPCLVGLAVRASCRGRQHILGKNGRGNVISRRRGEAKTGGRIREGSKRWATAAAAAAAVSVVRLPLPSPSLPRTDLISPTLTEEDSNEREATFSLPPSPSPLGIIHCMVGI